MGSSSFYETAEGACKEMLVNAFVSVGWKLHIVGSRDTETVVKTYALANPFQKDSSLTAVTEVPNNWTAPLS